MTTRTRSMWKAGLMAVAGALAACLPLACQAQARDFPARPIRIITPFAPGNTLDAALRIAGEKMKESTGQMLIIDNKPGGAGLIAAQTAMAAPPDGYTLLLGGSGLMTINPHTFEKLPYDPEKSFRPVTNFVGSALVLAASPTLPANTLQEFIAYAKANPGKVSFASFTAGNSSHFAGVILNKRAGIDMLHVPYNGTPPAVTSLMGGHVQVGFLPLLAVRQQIDSGKLKVFAVTSDKRSPLLPNVPTFLELGYPDLDLYIWAALFAPAGTPDAIVQKLNAELGKALRSDEVAEKFREMDFTPLPTSPEEFTAFMRNDSKRWAEAVRISGFKASQ